MFRRKEICPFICLAVLWSGVSTGLAGAAETTPVQAHTRLLQSIDGAAATGKRTQAWQNERQQLLDEIQALELQRAWAEFQLEKTERWLAAELKNTTVLEKNLASAAATREQLEPFLEVLYETLELHVQRDMPFNLVERNRRLVFIRSALDDPGRSLSDKLGRLFEAMQVEVDYGYTVEAGEELVELAGGQFCRATLLRLGRLALFRILDGGNRLERFEVQSGKWVEISVSYIPEVEKAMDIARKKRVTTLLHLPIGKSGTVENAGNVEQSVQALQDGGSIQQEGISNG